MKKANARIKDIAIKAGVPTGTVDRVIHNRGRVAPDVQKRVLEIFEESKQLLWALPCFGSFPRGHVV